MKNTYRFHKIENKWYIDLPLYLEMGIGEQADLEMVAGADVLLDIVSNYSTEVSLSLSEDYVDDTYTELSIISKDDFGAFYKINTDYSSVVGDMIWLCAVTCYVFDGKFPDTIWFKKV